MRSTTALETGTKPTKLYLIVQYNNRHDLLALPESYTDLQAHVKRLYNIDKGWFYVETDGFNSSLGARVRIPDEAWEDTVQLLLSGIDGTQLQNDSPRLLGNVYIIRRPFESIDGDLERTLETESFVPNKGELVLNEPFTATKTLLIQVAKIDAEQTSSSSPRSNIQLLDQNRNAVLTISILPTSGWIFLTTPSARSSFPSSLKNAFPLDANSEHVIIIRKEGRHFHIFCDFKPFGVVEGPNHAPLSTVIYDLGLNSSLKEPVSAAVYPDLLHAFDGSALFKSLFPTVDNETLLQKIIACDGINATYVSEVLSAVRNGNGLLSESYSMINWHAYDTRQHNNWFDLKWNMHHNSMFFARFVRAPKGSNTSSSYYGRSSEELDVTFGSGLPERKGDSPRFLLRISLDTANNMAAHQTQNGSGGGSFSQLFAPSPHFPQEHTVAIIYQQNNIHFVYDFMKSSTFDKTWTPDKIKFTIATDCVIEAGVYEFGN